MFASVLYRPTQPPCFLFSFCEYFLCVLTDQELRNVIDKLAQFVARNGPEFEKMTMEKQKDNPKFSFLFGGEYFGYYKYKLAIEQQQRTYIKVVSFFAALMLSRNQSDRRSHLSKHPSKVSVLWSHASHF